MHEIDQFETMYNCLKCFMYFPADRFHFPNALKYLPKERKLLCTFRSNYIHFLVSARCRLETENNNGLKEFTWPVIELFHNIKPKVLRHWLPRVQQVFNLSKHAPDEVIFLMKLFPDSLEWQHLLIYTYPEMLSRQTLLR